MKTPEDKLEGKAKETRSKVASQVPRAVASREVTYRKEQGRQKCLKVEEVGEHLEKQASRLPHRCQTWPQGQRCETGRTGGF